MVNKYEVEDENENNKHRNKQLSTLFTTLLELMTRHSKQIYLKVLDELYCSCIERKDGMIVY